MKRSTTYLLLGFLMLAATILSACGPAAAVKGPHVNADQVVITGVIEAINGDTWTINGQAITIDPSVVHGGPFNVGDTIKVEATAAQDGSLIVESVEAPDAEDETPEVETPEVETPEVETETPEAEETPEPGEDESEVVGVVTAIDASSITIDGTVYSLSAFTEIDGDVQAGDTVKLELVTNADGTVTVREVEKTDDGEGHGSDDSDDSGDDDSDGNSGSDSGSDDGSGDD